VSLVLILEVSIASLLFTFREGVSDSLQSQLSAGIVALNVTSSDDPAMHSWNVLQESFKVSCLIGIYTERNFVDKAHILHPMKTDIAFLIVFFSFNEKKNIYIDSLQHLISLYNVCFSWSAKSLLYHRNFSLCSVIATNMPGL